MADRTPFENLFDPDQQSIGGVPGLFGMIGRSMGVSNSRTDAVSAGAAEFSKIMQGTPGMTAQQAMLQLMNTEAGQRLLRLPGSLKELEGLIQTTQPPAPTVLNPGDAAMDRYGNTIAVRPHAPQNISPGGALVDPNTNKPMFNQPPTKAQEFDHFVSKIQGLTANQLSELAKAQILPAENQRIAAIREGVKQGIYSPAQGAELEMLVLGGSNTIEIKDGYRNGVRTGDYIIINKLTGRTEIVSPRGDDPGVPKPTPKDEADRVNMFLGTGPWGQIGAFLDDNMRAWFGERYGTDDGKRLNEQKRGINQLNAMITSFPTVVGRTNVVVEAWKKLQPRLFGSTSDALHAGLELRRLVDAGMRENQALITGDDAAITKEARDVLSKEYIGFMRISRLLPSEATLLSNMERVAKGEIPTPDASTGAKIIGNAVATGAGAVKDVFGGGQPTAKPVQPQQSQQPSTSVPMPRPRPSAVIDQGVTVENIAKMNLEELKKLTPASVPPEMHPVVVNRLQQLLKERAAGKK